MMMDMVKKTIVTPDVSLKEAMRLLSNSSKYRVLFVTDEENRLIGSMTDGDIRRAILKGIRFDCPISEIMFKVPRFVKSMDSEYEHKARRYVLDEGLFAIPVLDEQGRIVNILSWFDFFDEYPTKIHEINSFTNPVVIMAGGRGMRLDPFTKILPKPLIPFGDKPIIDRIMDNFNKYGFRHFILTLNYKKEIIKTYFKENKSSYIVEWVEEEEFLGTAGGLSLLKEKLKETFFICNCDVLLESDFKNMLLWHKGERALATLIGCHKEIVLPYGTLELTDGYLKSIKEKPIFDMILNTGVYIMEPQVLEYIDPGEHIDMNHLISRIKDHGKVTVYPVCEGWFDLGDWVEYKESVWHLQNGDLKFR